MPKNTIEDDSIPFWGEQDEKTIISNSNIYVIKRNSLCLPNTDNYCQWEDNCMYSMWKRC
jgi:hypothetical protein